MTPIFAAPDQSFSVSWIPLAVAVVAALAALAGAAMSVRSAKALKVAELEVQRVRDLENRISQRKYETYQPMIELLRDLLDPARSQALIGSRENFLDKIADFSAWIGVYGSDGAVRAFHNFMQAVYHNPPVPVLMRLYADFLVAIRRDIGNPDTEIGRTDLLGLRINDLYDLGGGEIYVSLTSSFDEVCRTADWPVPWEIRERSD